LIDAHTIAAADRLETFMPFAVSLALGLLIGTERQRAHAGEPETLPGGVRTFPLMALLGCTAAWLGAELGTGAFVAIAVGAGALVVAAYVVTSFRGDVGLSTEVSLLLTFALGAVTYRGQGLLASALAVAATVLLSLQKPLHGLAQRIEEDDLYAALKLAVVSVIVLPILPDERFGPPPYEIFNPFKIWLLVVFIAGIGFAGYVGIKVLGARRGIGVAGLLGGIVSSTAATLSFSARSRETPDLSRAFALAIALAWAAMFVRVLVSVAVANRALVPLVAAPVGAGIVASVAGALFLYLRAGATQTPADVAYRNPFSLMSAAKFALLFVAVLFVARFAQVQFADRGVLAAAALSGLVDVDAMTLTLSRLASNGDIGPDTAARGICLTVASNTITKAVLAAMLGAPALRAALVPVAAATLGAGVVGLLVGGL
jgi:uncharacterized membrane protein (DUF4010 family)